MPKPVIRLLARPILRHEGYNVYIDLFTKIMAATIVLLKQSITKVIEQLVATV